MLTLIYRCRQATLALAVLFIMALPLAAAPDYEREQRWANEILPGLIVGEPIYLTQKNLHQFLGIYATADNALMGVVVAHGMGLHPDSGMIGTLRQRLADEGYTTLSIQMPVLAADASYLEYPNVFPEAAERLQLAVNYLKLKGYKRIAIVSHSNGSRMTRTYMVNNPADISAWVALSLTQGDNYEGITAPVLDLYAENDLPHVLSANAKRKNTLINRHSKQRHIAEADHFFAGQEEPMIQAVKAFLDNVK